MFPNQGDFSMHFSLSRPIGSGFLSALILLGAGAAAAQTLNLKGRVLDKATMLGVAGATVKVTGTAKTTTTDSEGRFTITGSVGLTGGKGALAREPWFQDGSLFLESKSATTAELAWFGASGESLASVRRDLRAGVNKLDAFGAVSGDFAGFLRVKTGGESWTRRALHTAGAGHVAWVGGELPAAARGLSKASAAGSVDVSCEKLNGKTVPYTSDSQDLGDIVLDYPERKIGVGANPIYGATILFDGTKGRAAASAELQAKWQDWPRFTPSDIKFNVARDPQYLADTNRMTLQSCCNSQWGYDDIQAKIGLYEDCQIHVEYIGMGEYDTPIDSPTPNANPSGVKVTSGASYINSGVYVASRYEVQIQAWDTAAASIPGAHDMGAIVNDYTPVTNQNKLNGVWQAYDITYRGARFSGTTMTTQPYMSVWWNGVLTHDNRKVNAAASGLSNHSGEEHTDPVVYGLKLQSEGRDVRFRNIWIKKLVLDQAQTKVGY